jgi:hypothetical protein
VDFSDAVSQHLAWKHNLRRILLGRERRREPGRTEAVDGDHCPLGEWLREQDRQLEEDPLHQLVLEQHRVVHDLAIRMVTDPMREMGSLDMVFLTGEFQISSQSLLESLERLRRKYRLQEEPLCETPLTHPREGLPSPDVPG